MLRVQHECCTIAIHAVGELHKTLIRLLLTHTHPLALAMTDVERVVVAEASRPPLVPLASTLLSTSAGG